MLIVTRLRNPGPEPWLQFRFINFPGQSSKFRSLVHSGKEQQGSFQDEWIPILPPLVRSLFYTKDLANPFVISPSSTSSSMWGVYHSHLSAASKKPLHEIESFMYQRKDYPDKAEQEDDQLGNLICLLSPSPPLMGAWKYLGLYNFKNLPSQIPHGKTYSYIRMHEIIEIMCLKKSFPCLNIAHLCTR